MFNGIIHNQGIIFKLEKKKNSLNIFLKTNLKFKKNDIGESVCCNGVCLTLTNVKKNYISFYLSKETLDKSNFKFCKLNEVVNLEKSLTYGKKISGHYVQGHADTTAKVLKILIEDKTWVVNFLVAKSYSKYLIDKGSIAINGVSLTISKVEKNKFSVNIIPHSLRLTNLIKLKKNSYVNVEFDIFSKYLISLKK